MDFKAILMTTIGVALAIVLANVIMKQVGMSNYESDAIMS